MKCNGGPGWWMFRNGESGIEKLLGKIFYRIF